MTLLRTLVLAFLVVVAIPAVALAANTFGDDDGSVHEGSIEAIAKADITKGCNPPQNDMFCPDRDVKRGEMAAFLVRALDLPNTDADHFDDDDGSTFERDINRLAEAGITKGCNPPANDDFCPDESITRGQMAAFLARALSLSDADDDTFSDDDGNTFENDIEKIATEGITKGCNPPTNDRYCPDDATTRGEMATFLTRALDLEIPPTDDHPTVYEDGEITGNACPCKVTGRVELKGAVNLEGDLMVDGGALVARPGVTLNGNRFQIMFMNGGKADFQGSKTSTWSGDGSNANLKRDVEFRNLRRIMFHEGAGVSTLKYVAVIDTGTTGVLGDYPLHWHLNGNSTRGTLVEGVVVLNGKNHAYVPHGSHGITLRDVIAKNTTEEAIWWDKPNQPPCKESDRNCTLNDSHDITITRALVDGVDTSRKRKYEITGMLLGQGNGNSVVGSVVRNVASGTSCSAYHWPEGAHGEWSFVGNTAYTESCSIAIFVWENNRDEVPSSVIEDFTTDGIIDHGAYRNAYLYDNVSAPTFNGHAIGYTVQNSTFDAIELRRHPADGEVRFINVDADSLMLDDGDGGAGTYIFDDTNLTCADVTYEKPHPDSQVVINGKQC